MRLAFTLCTALALTACVPVGPDDAPQEVRTFRGNLVLPDPQSPGRFEVFTRSGDAGADLWCAAAEFAEDELRVPAARRIYLAEPLGPSATRPGAKSAVFTVSPDDALLASAEDLPRRIDMGVDHPGRNFLPIHGRAACRPIYEWPWDS